jgi:hypothetical protein
VREILLLVLFFSFLSCGEDKPSNIDVKARSYEIPRFDQDSAYQFIKAQVDFGPRVPGSRSHEQCANWLEHKLESFGLSSVQESFHAVRYDGQKIEGKNIVASLNPKAKKRIFLCAHWDSRFQADHDKDRKNEPILGADDGASGVGVALEVARQLAMVKDFKLGLDIVFFDAEDQGEDGGSNSDSWGLGAQKWSNLHKGDYSPKYGILLDMVGAKDAQFYREDISVKMAPNVVHKIWKTAERLGFGDLFIAQDGRSVIDDHYFIYRNAGWPVADIIHTKQGQGNGFGAHWHTHGDDMTVIDKGTLRKVGKVVLTVLCEEDLGR